MSFFNKIWKNIRDKKDSHSLDIQTAKSATLSTHHQPLGQKGKSFYKRIDQLIHQSESEVNESKNDEMKESRKEEVKESKNEEINVSKNVSKNEASSSGIENIENISPNDGSGIMTMSDDDEVILPPGIVTEMVKSKNQVSRHVSVSRSGRYKQKHRKRSNLFDVVTSCTDDGDKKESNGIIASNDADMSSRKKLPPSVMATSLSLSPGFDSNDLKSIEQDCDRTVIEVEVMTTSQSLLSSLPSQAKDSLLPSQAKDSLLPPQVKDSLPLSSQAKDSLLPSQAKDSSSNPSSIPSFNQTGKICHSNQSKEGIKINPSFITFAKHSDSNIRILPHFNYNNNSNPINFGQEAIKL